MKSYIVRHIAKKRKKTQKKGGKGKGGKGQSYVYRYTDQSGKPLGLKKGLATIGKLKGLYIPPAHDEVKITLRVKDKVWAIGQDAKGRSQYLYNPTFQKKQEKAKFSHMIDFGESYHKIERQIHKDLYTEGESKEKQVALILRLVIDCGFRIGSDKYAKENQSFGVSTLETQHLKTSGSQLEVDFIGKKGVRNVCSVKNKKALKELRTKKKHLKKGSRLFQYRNGSQYYDVRSSDVNTYLKRFGNFSVKNFRTWTANLEMIHHLVKASKGHMGQPLGPKQTQKEKTLNECADKVCEMLHNTRSVCKSSYLDPTLQDLFVNDWPQFQRIFRGCTTKDQMSEGYLRLLRSSN